MLNVSNNQIGLISNYAFNDMNIRHLIGEAFLVNCNEIWLKYVYIENCELIHGSPKDFFLSARKIFLKLIMYLWRKFVSLPMQN